MNPFTNTDARPHREAEFSREEVALANRNHGLALEALRYDITPVGMHYLLTHFDILIWKQKTFRSPLEVKLKTHCRYPWKR